MGTKLQHFIDITLILINYFHKKSIFSDTLPVLGTQAPQSTTCPKTTEKYLWKQSDSLFFTTDRPKYGEKKGEKASSLINFC